MYYLGYIVPVLLLDLLDTDPDADALYSHNWRYVILQVIHQKPRKSLEDITRNLPQ
jgi:hypothetical protein